MAYQIKITISEIEPPIWRRVRIPGSITFSQLHRVIQVAFGWLDYHLHQFTFADIVVTEPDADFSVGELYGERARAFDPEKTIVNELFDQYDRCIYEYDFGDRWVHEVVVEKRLKDTKRNSVPVCLGGARQRPPEDVGGVSGYQEFLEIIRDKGHPEREELLRWAEKDTRGKPYDPECFCIDEVNRRLSYVLENDPKSAERLLMGKTGLTGRLRFGFFEPYVEVGGKRYTWEQIGDLMMWLDEGLTVSIKVGRHS